ncbi:unnamed protein product [Urochloa humidicola]
MELWRALKYLIDFSKQRLPMSWKGSLRSMQMMKMLCIHDGNCSIQRNKCFKSNWIRKGPWLWIVSSYTSQMNKTPVELFQMYDDHRRKGVFFSTEKEFRGYYALLKLDKHPGYKVEPAELSLDLAKMSHEIIGSPEILFAREVAR